MSRDILSSSRRIKRRRVVFRVSFVFFLLLLLLAGGVFGIFSIDNLKIKQVSIEGTFVLSEQELREKVESILEAKILNVFPQNRVFSFPSEKAKDILMEQFGRIDEIKIEKNLDSNVLIKISERKPVALLCWDGEENESCFFADKSGVLFEKAPVFSSGVFLKFFDDRKYGTKLGEKKLLINEEVFQEILDFAKGLEQFLLVEKIRLKEEDGCEFYSTDGRYLILDIKSDWNLMYDNFIALLENTISKSNENFEYIDLRFGNKVFFK
ncbi:hypothetical protein KKA27_04040 [Patescibacteria group bacterium]|nr:hypothetical protein [Patescibacteria group bacterium]MBU2633589.1 hypothetical protein [Patescibacteria group bacterium]